MSFDREIDNAFDKAGENLEKGTASFFHGIGKGFKNLKYNKKVRTKFGVGVGIVAAGSVYLEKYGIDNGWYELPVLSNVSELPYVTYPLAATGLIVGTAVLLYIVGSAEDKSLKQFQMAFERCGLYSRRMLVNDKGQKIREFPILLRQVTQPDGGLLYRFKNVGIPMKVWKEAEESIQSSLGQTIATLGPTDDTAMYIEMKLGGTTVPDAVEYSKELVTGLKPSQVVLGLDKNHKKVVHDFQKVPHMLIAGLTGSGKSVELRAIAYQAIEEQGANLWTIDFKGGIEFKSFEPIGVKCVWERDEAHKIIKYLIEEHYARIELFKENNVKNIDEYNEQVSEDRRIKRCYLAIDEVAELTDPTGVPKEEKETFDMINGDLSTIARLCRATGIHLLLATQRPDAKVITGQIKTNIGARVCGYMPDTGASMTALGSAAATKLRNSGGRFLYSIGNEAMEMQSPYFRDSDINLEIQVDYKKGMMIDYEAFNSSIPETPSAAARKDNRIRHY